MIFSTCSFIVFSSLFYDIICMQQNKILCFYWISYFFMFSFQKESFIKAVNSQSIRLFLEWFTETAMFCAFLESRLEIESDVRGRHVSSIFSYAACTISLLCVLNVNNSWKIQLGNIRSWKKSNMFFFIRQFQYSHSRLHLHFYKSKISWRRT